MKQAVVDKIEQSDFYQELIRKEQAELLEKRKAAAEALASIDKDTETRVRGIIKAIAEAGKVAAEIEKEAQEARSRVDALRAERNGAAAKAEREKRGHHDFLLETASPVIDTAIAWFNDKFDELRGGTAIQQRHRGKFDMLHMQRQITTVSNHKARVAALRYCRRAIETLQGMKLKPEPDNERLKRLAVELPDPNNFFDEFESRKPEKDAADIPYWARFKSDEQHRAEMDDLLQKADSLKRRKRA